MSNCGIRIPTRLLNRLCTYVVCACLACSAARSQEPDSGTGLPELTYSVKSQLVQIYMTVTDGGRMVTDLSEQDIRIFEDGAFREVSRLDNATVPLQVALLFDMSGSMLDALPTIQEAATYFVESLKPEDRVSLVLFNAEIQCVPQLTDDRSPIIEAIRKARARGSTRLHDTLLFAMKHLSDKEGRKVIVCFSDGDDTAHTTSLPLVLNAAARYGYPIYTIWAGASLRSGSLKSVLRRLAEINSGRMYVKEDPRDLRSTFAEVSSELRDAYVVNYYTQAPFDGRWHDVRISLSNPRYSIHSRKGFFAKAGGAGSVFADLSDRPTRAPAREITGRRLPAAVQPAAAKEMLQAPLPVREFDTQSPRSSPPPPPPAGQRAEKAVFKVESRLVEVPVLLASPSGKEIPELTEKDFRIYEDDSLRETTFFGHEAETRDMDRLRSAAISRARALGNGAEVRQAEAEPVMLGRVYLVLDDLMTEVSAFQPARRAAERIIREHQHPLRPITLHLTSEGSAVLNSNESVEGVLDRVRRAVPRSSVTLNDDVMTIHEAYLIERDDQDARGLAELRYAANQQITFSNSLGSVRGQLIVDPEMVRRAVQSTMLQLIGENASQVCRALDSLQAIIGAAVADEGDYPRVIVVLSSGFSLGRDSSRADCGTKLDEIAALAKRNGVRIFSLDAAGLKPEQPVPTGGNLSFLVSNPHLMGILTRHAQDFRHEIVAPLQQLAGETGGRFFTSTNDLTGAAATAMRTGGRIYYLAFMSRQPVDGRFHRIRVTCSVPGLQVHARKGYSARLGNEPAGPEESLEGENWEAVIARANDALRSNNLPEASRNLEKMVRRFPNEVNLWYNLGAVRLQLRQNAAAVEAFQRAFLLSHEDAATGAALTRALVAAGFPDAAIETMETVVRRHPEDLQLIIQLGRTYEAASRATEAHQAYRRILDLTLTPPLEVYVLLMRTAAALGREVEAGVFAADYVARGGDRSVIEQWHRQTTGTPHGAPSTGKAVVNP